MTPTKNETETSLYRQLAASGVLFISVFYLACFPAQSDFYKIILSAGIGFAAYSYLTFYTETKLRHILILGSVIRIGLIFVFPNLSDDIYRFVWDGQLSTQGINPYGYLPSTIITENHSPYWQQLFSNMNSPDYYTIYPPLTQLVFYISTWAGENIWWNSLVIKVFFLIAEVFTFWGLVRLLGYMKKPLALVAIYYLNPLIIIEGIGNLHFEIIMISFLVWSIYYTLVKNNLFLGALLFALSIASKLLPLMFLPYFLFKMKGRYRVRFFSGGTVFLTLGFLPIILGLDFANFGSSIDLYFQKFEFNAGIYYLLRYVGQLWSGYNLIHYIGPLLGITAMLIIINKAIKSTDYSLPNFFDFAFFSFCAYLLLATTVHPWYLAIPIMLSVFVQFRFVITWSFLIMLSYINYSYSPYYENLWVVGLEYLLVFGMIAYELLNIEKRKSLSKNSQKKARYKL